MIRIFTALLVLSVTATFAIGQTTSDKIPFTKRMRVIIDNDFSGDPDGLFQLSHLLLSPSVETRGIIGSHLSPKDFIDPSEKQAENAVRKAKEILNAF